MNGGRAAARRRVPLGDGRRDDARSATDSEAERTEDVRPLERRTTTWIVSLASTAPGSIASPDRHGEPVVTRPRDDNPSRPAVGDAVRDRLLAGVVLAAVVVGTATVLAHPVGTSTLLEATSSTTGALHGWRLDLVGPWIPNPYPAF